MQSIEHCTAGRTKLYAVRACCIVCNMHAKRFSEARAEWMVFEADLRNVDSLSLANFFGLGTALISESSRIGSQRQCCQERPSLRFKGTAKFLLQAPGGLYITTVYSTRSVTRFHKQNTLRLNNKYTRFPITVKTQRSYKTTKTPGTTCTRHQSKTQKQHGYHTNNVQ